MPVDEKHLDWLIKSRVDNQTTSLKLLNLFRKYEKEMNVAHLRYDGLVTGQMLISVAFSLWRAAFLADRDPYSGAKHAIEFLEKLILDNAVNYTLDRNARDWTWAYYVSNAWYHLKDLKDVWPDLELKDIETLDACEMWTHYQLLFSIAVDRFGRDLASAKSAKARKSKSKKSKKSKSTSALN